MDMPKKFVLKCCGARLYVGEICRCKQIEVIQRSTRHYFNILHSLKKIKIGKEIIHYGSIDAFIKSSKKENDSKNKTREAIIDGIVNGKIPDNYYTLSRRWAKLRKATIVFVDNIFPTIAHENQKVICKQRGGRKYNYDFDFIVKEGKTIIQTEHIELKFNAEDLDHAPQFSSPMKPSQYLSQNFEEFHYNKILPEITACLPESLEIPAYIQYAKEIHNNSPKCMEAFQKLYYEGCKGSSKFVNDDVKTNFYNNAISKSREGITEFIKQTDLDAEKLTQYLLDSQQGKIYMLFHDGKFVKQQINLDDYKIEKVEKNSEKSRYECLTKTGIKLHVLLRWKNGNGIAFPAFQISAQR